MKTFTILLIFLAFLSNIAFTQRPSFLKKDSIRSKLDDSTQVFYYNNSNSDKAQPLVVELHSWSNSSHSQKDILAAKAQQKGWNYILPDFRGVNNHIKACCSDYVIADIDEAIDWAIKNMKVDKSKIFIVGNSGGGYATLAMYMKSHHDINTFSAWSSISDLRKWYDESVERKNKYGPQILLCTGSGKNIENQKAWDRSPIFWDTPIKKRKKSKIQIYAGIHDGYTGSVPISHSIDFYNKLLFDYDVQDITKFVSEQESNTLISTQNFIKSGINKKIDDRQIHFQKSAKNITLTIFEGGHEILSNVALELL
jgi:dipeptidyl aminopeptidase/acylaminoacyl peptidase